MLILHVGLSAMKNCD